MRIALLAELSRLESSKSCTRQTQHNYIYARLNSVAVLSTAVSLLTMIYLAPWRKCSSNLCPQFHVTLQLVN